MKFQATLVLVALIGSTSAQFDQLFGVTSGFGLPGFNGGSQGNGQGSPNGQGWGFQNGFQGGVGQYGLGQYGQGQFGQGQYGQGQNTNNNQLGSGFFARTWSALNQFPDAIRRDVAETGQKISALNLSGRAAKQASDLMGSMGRVADGMAQMILSQDIGAAGRIIQEMIAIVPNMMSNFMSLIEAKINVGMLFSNTIKAKINLDTSFVSDLASFVNPANLMRLIQLPTFGLSTISSFFNSFRPPMLASSFNPNNQGYGIGSTITDGLGGVLDSTGDALDGLLGSPRNTEPGRRIDRLRL